jgi:hypothetical protein
VKGNNVLERIGRHSCDSYFKITAVKHAEQEAVKWEGNTLSPKVNIRRYNRYMWQIFKSSTGWRVQMMKRNMFCLQQRTSLCKKLASYFEAMPMKIPCILISRPVTQFVM